MGLLDSLKAKFVFQVYLPLTTHKFCSLEPNLAAKFLQIASYIDKPRTIRISGKDRCCHHGNFFIIVDKILEIGILEME